MFRPFCSQLSNFKDNGARIFEGSYQRKYTKNVLKGNKIILHDLAVFTNSYLPHKETFNFLI